jgi:hypothetical protein
MSRTPITNNSLRTTPKKSYDEKKINGCIPSLSINNKDQQQEQSNSPLTKQNKSNFSSSMMDSGFTLGLLATAARSLPPSISSTSQYGRQTAMFPPSTSRSSRPAFPSSTVEPLSSSFSPLVTPPSIYSGKNSIAAIMPNNCLCKAVLPSIDIKYESSFFGCYWRNRNSNLGNIYLLCFCLTPPPSFSLSF